MLSQIADGSELSNVTLVTDRASLDGWKTFVSILNGVIQTFDEIHVFMFERLEKEQRQQILPQYLGKVHFHDYACDPLGWIDENNAIPASFCIPRLIPNCGGKNTIIIIDSLCHFLEYFGIQHFHFNIERIRDCFSNTDRRFSLFSLLHRDLCDATTVKGAEYVSTCVINLVSESEICGESRGLETKKHNLCSIIHKKMGGKITEYIESFFINGNSIVTSKPWQPDNMIKDVDLGNSSSDEEAVRSTFNMKLSKREKEARGKLVMPYVKPAHLKVRMDEGAPSSGGIIYYQPDEGDDFDDEDPDDDLDF